jgi:hypothetical protein
LQLCGPKYLTRGGWSSPGTVAQFRCLVRSGRDRQPTRSGGWRSRSFFAGLAGIINNKFYVITPNYAFKIDVTAWGWIHLILGVIVVAAGIGLLTGQTWARVVGVVIAVLSALANFLFLPHYPLWSILVIALDLMIIWALLVYGRVIGSREA